ncbi:MAG: dihydroorotate dehydrogenase [Candidatus Diapherotrites archaeon]|nr:dihydroorotate dehydrogenase [Candidatus Diapherotrites archaeon]
MLSTSFAGIELENPTVLAAGILGTSAAILKRVADSGAGAVTIKSIGPKKREGHSNPTVLFFDSYLMNAVGLPTPGYRNMEREWEELKEINVPVIASIYASSIEEFVEVAQYVASRKPDAIELNISCPNTKAHGMLFGKDPSIAHDVVSQVKEVTNNIPIFAKLTPNTDRVIEVARACEEAGADAIVAFNTWGPGMYIDINTRRPVLHYRTGGVSGPAVKPLVVKGIYELYEHVSLPILGVGGITNGNDAIEMIMAGASAIGIGSAVYYRGIDVFKRICDEMQGWMLTHDYKSIKELVGVAHE